MKLLNGLNKLLDAFYDLDFADMMVAAAVFMMLRTVEARDKRFYAGTGMVSALFAVLMVSCISFMKYDHAGFLFANSFQFMLALFCILGFTILFYLLFRLAAFSLEKGWQLPAASGGKQSFYETHFLAFGTAVIFVCWMVWILFNYPGTGCPDSSLQLEQFMGVKEWGAAHPPLSSAVMGVLFTLGRWLVDANFGFFLYCLFHSCVGAWAFALSMRKLQQLGVPTKWCTVGILYFALTPLWGTYAQWYEKDLLYAAVATLQAVYMLEIIRNRRCTVKDLSLMTVFGILAALLRNNGIYAIVPALALLVFWLKGAERKKMILALVATLLVFEGVTRGIYGSLGIAKPLAAEAYGIPFQQTARYVCEYGDEVTEYEKEVIGSVLHYDALTNYDPVLTDPVKIHYFGADLSEYNKVWFRMFWKHPGCYVAAFINKAYGYLAPVAQNIEGWIGIAEPDWFFADLGIYHAFNRDLAQILVQIWNLSMTLPLVRYLCTPGLYTWIVLALSLMLLRKRRYGALIMFVPSLMNILVCLDSPMANAIRYELPTVAAVPLLIGWAAYSLRGSAA
ncbi:MAG: DUF6020 family protein [Eubacterium sp.]|nr:DUF6020 family protein [Eubacterium sp.]MCM1240061.1 DUF6020 family protein [Lachnospiraceae bacterium]MCM1303805.1 DUF6020 family protein [Butyrivibrio sp.]MCM1342847.1 DUF6020 family protein [Muribaculaceae bacterium]MCM1410474.1 DUF6020 family protein [Lachnospiraceae bacterium]